MSDSSERLRALFLATLMVFSVFAGTIAMAGTVAAANSGSVIADPATPGATSTHTATATAEAGDTGSLTSITVDYSVGTDPADISNVGQGDVTATLGTTDVTGSITDVSGSNNGQTLTITFDGTPSVSGGDSVELEYTDVQNPSSAAGSDVDITVNGGAAATATVTYGQTGTVVQDDTQSANTTTGIVTEIADVSGESSGYVNEVEVNAQGGSSVGIDATDIEHINVELYDGSGSLVAENRTVPYSANPTSVDFTGTAAESDTQVQRVRVTAKVSGSAADGDSIDAQVETFGNGDTTDVIEGPSSPYDTGGVQTVRLDADGAPPAVVSAYVNSFTQGDVENANVSIINVNTGTVINPDDPLITNNAGNTDPLGVPFGTYRARATKGGFTTETSSAATLTASDNNRQLDVTLQATAEPKRVVLEPVGPSSAPADGTSLIQYRATVYGDIGTQTDVVLEGIDVSLTDDGDSVELAPDTDGDLGTDDPALNTTDANGETYFTARSDVIQTATLTAEVVSNTSATDTAEAQFGVLSGEGTIPGQVFAEDTTEGLAGAQVWAIDRDQFEDNERFVDDTVPSDGATVFYRLVNSSTGDVVDNSDYRIQIDPVQGELANVEDDGFVGDEDNLQLAEDDEQIGKVNELNTTDRAVGSGVFAMDKDDDSNVQFYITVLEPGTYTLEKSTKLTNASREASSGSAPDDPFTSVGTDQTVSENLTYAYADSQSNPYPTGPVLTDQTDEDGDFLLTKLYTNGQEGQYYVVASRASGYGSDFADVYVQEDGHQYEDQSDTPLVLAPEQITGDVNITNLALLPNADASLAGPADEPASYEEFTFGNQTDAWAQRIPRDGTAVDVILVETFNEENASQAVNKTVTIEVPDEMEGSASRTNFTGEFVALAGNEGAVTRGNDTVTLSTGADGQAIVWLRSDDADVDLWSSGSGDALYECEAASEGELQTFTHGAVTAQVDTAAGNTDVTCKDFVAPDRFKRASLSGILTDDADNRVNNTVVYAADFRYDISTAGENFRAASTIVFITPDDAANSTTGLPEGAVEAEDVDDSSDEFHVVQYTWNGITSEPGSLIGSEFNVTRDELRTYTFPASVSDGQGFPLIDGEGTEFKLVEANGAGDSEYTLRPVPAVGNQAGPDTTAYTVRGVGLQLPPEDQVANASDNVKPGFTGTANLAFGLEINRTVAVTDLDAPSTAQAGDTITVSANVSNEGNVQVTPDVEFRLGGQVVDTQEVTLNASETKTVTFEIDTSGVAPGTYTHGVFVNGASQTAQITIESDDGQTGDGVIAQYDADDSGTIDDQELLNALADYPETLSDQDLLQLLSVYESN